MDGRADFVRRAFKSFICFFAAAIFFASCATMHDSRGRYHKVREGETLNSLAAYYGMKPSELAKLNNITEETKLIKGQKLYIGIKKVKEKKVARSGKRGRYKSSKRTYNEFDKHISLEGVKFDWPVRGPIYSSFGIRHGRRHDGIDIGGKIGTPIKAAADGVVVFNGYMRGYGNILILKHGKRVFTTYAHNERNLVSEGDIVKKGDVIAYLGATGRTSGPHLHFEIRYGSLAKNPIFYLPHENDEHRRLAEAARKREREGKPVISLTMGKERGKKYAGKGVLKGKSSAKKKGLVKVKRKAGKSVLKRKVIASRKKTLVKKKKKK